MKKIILTLSVLFQFNVSQGWQEFHGGDLTLIQATMIANNLIADIEKIPSIKHLTPLLLEGFLKTELISTSRDLILNGEKKVALVTKSNADMHGDIKLEINSELWSKLSENERNLLVMHELLNLTVLTDDDYAGSSAYLSKILLFRQITKKNTITLKQFIFSGFENCSFENMKTAYPLILTLPFLRQVQEELYVNQKKYCDYINIEFKKRFDSILK